MSKTGFENTCVQCHEQMPYGLNKQDGSPLVGLSICYNPSCPVYGLLQIGNEFIAEFFGKKEPSNETN